MIKILLSIYLLLSSFVLFAQGLFENDPIWRDEFNRDNVPSSMYWSYIVGMRGQESEYYTNSSNNVCVNNGKLIIRTLDEKKDKALCTSGRIHTLGRFRFYMAGWKLRQNVLQEKVFGLLFGCCRQKKVYLLVKLT